MTSCATRFINDRETETGHGHVHFDFLHNLEIWIGGVVGRVHICRRGKDKMRCILRSAGGGGGGNG